MITDFQAFAYSSHCLTVKKDHTIRVKKEFLFIIINVNRIDKVFSMECPQISPVFVPSSR